MTTPTAPAQTPNEKPKPPMFQLGDRTVTKEEYDREFAALSRAARDEKEPTPAPANK